MINNLDELIKEGVHLLDFYADWCGPCKIMSNNLNELKESIDIIKINTDLNPKIVFKYRVMSIPTLIFTKDGNIIEEITGIKTSDEIDKIISKIKEK